MLLLNEPENAYVQFLEGKSVDIRKYDIEPEGKEMETRSVLQAAMREDRDLIDKAQEAFVSFVRYYKEH